SINKKIDDEYFLEQINNWRIKLANYPYKKDKNKFTIEQINDIVQKFINQIIFLRICEDRNLPLYHKLKDTIEDRSIIKERLVELLQAADKKYNSGLFDNNNEILEIGRAHV